MSKKKEISKTLNLDISKCWIIMRITDLVLNLESFEKIQP